MLISHSQSKGRIQVYSHVGYVELCGGKASKATIYRKISVNSLALVNVAPRNSRAPGRATGRIGPYNPGGFGSTPIRLAPDYADLARQRGALSRGTSPMVVPESPAAGKTLSRAPGAINPAAGPGPGAVPEPHPQATRERALAVAHGLTFAQRVVRGRLSRIVETQTYQRRLTPARIESSIIRLESSPTAPMLSRQHRGALRID